MNTKSNWIAVVLLSMLAAPLAAEVRAAGPAAGEVRWFDLLTEDAEKASSFYTELLGWQIVSTSTGARVALHDGVPIAGISEIEDSLPEIAEATWLVGIIVSDVGAATARAEDLGAKVIEPVRRVPGWGTYSVLADPQGAEVMLLVTERRMGGTEGPGAWVWSELWSRDPEGSADFYAKLLGYGTSGIERPGGDYSVFTVEEEPRAGLVQLESEEIETSWAPYVGVVDLAASLTKTRELGGTIYLGPDPELGGGRVALIGDPTGAGLFLYQLEEVSP